MDVTPKPQVGQGFSHQEPISQEPNESASQIPVSDELKKHRFSVLNGIGGTSVKFDGVNWVAIHVLEQKLHSSQDLRLPEHVHTPLIQNSSTLLNTIFSDEPPPPKRG